jgi:hypothetical protein
MRWNLSTQRRQSLVLIAGLGLVVCGCGERTNSIIPTPTQSAPPASEWKGAYTGTGTDPNTPPVAGTPGK